MEKDFDTWNKEKKALEIVGKNTLHFSERDIWWCSLGLNIGSEQDGKSEFFERPVLIIKKFNSSLVWILPVTSKLKEGIYYHQIVLNKKISILVLSQLRLVSAKRFRRYVGKISRGEFIVIREKLIKFLAT